MKDFTCDVVFCTGDPKDPALEQIKEVGKIQIRFVKDDDLPGSDCGKTQDDDHYWIMDCEKCAVCGQVRSNAHSWNACKCSVCGKTMHDWRRHEGYETCNLCGELAIDLGDGIKLELIPISSGQFIMSSKERMYKFNDEPEHEVTISRNFYMGKYPVTQEQYEQLMGVNPSHFKGARNPVDTVSRKDSIEFCRKLGEICGLKGRLPTEAEWEYTCRAGTTTRYCFGDEDFIVGPRGGYINILFDYAWYNRGLGRTRDYDPSNDLKTFPVGQKKPNAWGLYDMHGNVWEWCLDRYGNYPSTPVTDPVGSSEGYFIVRGGAWNADAKNCCSAWRGLNSSGEGGSAGGFRVLVECS